MNAQALRQLPAVNLLVDDPSLSHHLKEYGRDAIVQAARRILEETRQGIRGGNAAPSANELLDAIKTRIDARPCLYRRVLNATGVILHTNLGRAPIADAAWQAMTEAASYCDLEMDLRTGKRASRLRGVEEPLVAVTGAEAGMVVNNNAAAILLTLAGLAGKEPTAISRSQLVEIGGGFRLPTVMEASGSPLMEIGTTNRTHLKDYIAAIEEGAGLILCVHWSNFTMDGYVTHPPPEAIIEEAHRRGLMVALDLGSGALLDTTQHNLPKEDTVPQAVKQGFDAICFSGDKLLGGPQAGYIVGKQAAIERLKKHPLARALRCDKVQLAGCVATLQLYQRGEGSHQVPIWQMAHADTLGRAQSWRTALAEFDETRLDIIPAAGAVGGGSLPGGELPGHALALSAPSPEKCLQALRAQTPAIVGHIANDRVLLHPRTVHPRDDAHLIEGVRRVLAALQEG